MTFVYFIQFGNRGNGLVKIGRARDPKSRFSAIQTSCPFRLKLLGISENYTEEELHLRFAAERQRGEWFRFSKRLKDFIVALPPSSITVSPRQFKQFKDDGTPLAKLIRLCDGKVSVAAPKVGVTRQAIYKWLNGDPVTKVYENAILHAIAEIETKGLRA